MWVAFRHAGGIQTYKEGVQTYGGIQTCMGHMNIGGILIPPKSDNPHTCLYSSKTFYDIAK